MIRSEVMNITKSSNTMGSNTDASIIWNPMLPGLPCPYILVDGGTHYSGKFDI